MNNILTILYKYFNYNEFRKGQEEIILSILEKKNTLAVMPTGGGKSLCYQLPAVMLDGTAIVISPLIALMKDQVDALNKLNISATYINSSLEIEEIQSRVVNSIEGKYKLLYIAPERLESDFFMRILKEMKVSFLAIDEAHCISEWGHDFRPAYMHIKKALDARPIKPIAAFTATAGPEVQEDIIKSLNIGNTNRFIKGFDRPNLSYITIEDKTKIERLVKILKKSKNGSSIIYCGSRKRVDEYTFQLNKLGFQVIGYHAGMDSDARRAVQDSFISSETNIIVATNAFGMGIDKPDVRNVIHCDLTGTLEQYYQEAGRAGRDGALSYCTMIYNSSDIDLQEYFINSTHPEIEDMQKLYAALHYYSDKFNQLNMNSLILSEKLSLPQRTVNSILEIFERNELIQRYMQPSKAKIKITSSRDSLINYYQNTTNERREIITALMRHLNADVFNRFLDLNLLDLCRKYNIEEMKLIEALRFLSISDYIEYIPEQNAGTILLKNDKKPLEELPIDLNVIRERKKKAKQKLNVVLRYTETNDCKRNFILDYFQDSEYSSVCGRCSSCLASNSIKSIKLKNDVILNGVLNGLWAINARFGKTALLDFLKGKIGDKVKKYNLDKIEQFGILDEYTNYEIRDAIDKCIEKKLIRVSAGLYPILNITSAGCEYISKAAEHRLIEANINAEEELCQKLINLRTDLANREGISPRAIASDRTLRALAKSPPNNFKQLSSVQGIGSFITEKYGKLILSVIAGEVADEYEVKQEEVSKFVLKVIEQIKDGYNIDEIALKNDTDKGSIARTLQDAIMSDLVQLDWKYLLDESSYNKIKTFIYKKPHITLKSLRASIGIEIDYAILRIVSAIARRSI